MQKGASNRQCSSITRTEKQNVRYREEDITGHTKEPNKHKNIIIIMKMSGQVWEIWRVHIMDTNDVIDKWSCDSLL